MCRSPLDDEPEPAIGDGVDAAVGRFHRALARYRGPSSIDAEAARFHIVPADPGSEPGIGRRPYFGTPRISVRWRHGDSRIDDLPERGRAVLE